MPDKTPGKTAGKTADKTAGRSGAKGRRRLPSDQRREEFIEKSIALFAQEGFESSTRELARRLGVTQPLLYRYFPSKQDLITAVYDKVYVSRWQPEWEALIADRSQPLRARLLQFYTEYTDVIFRPDWIRIYLYSGLKGVEINARYMQLVLERILRPILAEIRHDAGLPPAEPCAEEIDAAWVIHGGMFYFGVIKLVYENRETVDKRAALEFGTDAMVDGLTRLMLR